MTTPTNWEERYQTNDLPWDTGSPDPRFQEAIQKEWLPKGRLLDIGCGTGTNARLFASAGFDVTAVDISPKAIEMAKTHPNPDGVRYELWDVLTQSPPGGPFDAVVDRGCFHVFDSDTERTRFAARVAESLRMGGVWLSLIGSTEGPARDEGPPRRNATEVLQAIEPELELVSLRAGEMTNPEGEIRAWWTCLSRKRRTPAQPSSER